MARVAVNFSGTTRCDLGYGEIYLAHLKDYSRQWGERRASDEWLAMLPVGAEPGAVVDHLIDEIIKDDPAIRDMRVTRGWKRGLRSWKRS